MGLYPRLDHKKSTKTTTKSEEVRVVVDYYYSGKRTKITTGVSCLVKDWDTNWRKKPSKNPIKTTDKDYRGKNLLIRNKISERTLRNWRETKGLPLQEITPQKSGYMKTS